MVTKRKPSKRKNSNASAQPAEAPQVAPRPSVPVPGAQPRPTVAQQHPVVGQQRPTAGQQRPAVGQPHPAVSQPRPTPAQRPLEQPALSTQPLPPVAETAAAPEVPLPQSKLASKPRRSVNPKEKAKTAAAAAAAANMKAIIEATQETSEEPSPEDFFDSLDMFADDPSVSSRTAESASTRNAKAKASVGAKAAPGRATAEQGDSQPATANPVSKTKAALKAKLLNKHDAEDTAEEDAASAEADVSTEDAPGTSASLPKVKPAKLSVAGAKIATSTEGESSEEAAPRKRKKVREKPRRWPFYVVLSLVVVALLAVAVFSWDRWFRFDDARELQGEWQLQGSDATLVIDGTTIKLTDDVSYAYTLDPTAKTLSFMFGNMAGSGRYRFSPDRSQLLIEETGSHTTMSTLTSDIAWMWDNAVRGAQGKEPSAFESSENTLALTRVSHDGLATPHADSAALAAANKASEDDGESSGDVPTEE